MANCLPCSTASSSSSEMLGKVLGAVCGSSHKEERAIAIQNGEVGRIKGTVVLMKKNLLDCEDVGASFLDKVYELFNRGVSFQLVSSNRFDPEDEKRGKVGKSAFLEKWFSKFTSISAGDVTFDISFEWDESMGTPGAFIVKNNHHSQFYLKTLTLHDVPGNSEGDGNLHFVCNSWVYPAHRYKYNRVFFANKPYLPSDTPEPLRVYREEELVNLRGNGEGVLKEWDRVYDYAYYNDLGSPDKGPEHIRPVLGGTEHLPYPRRGRTGRRANRKDVKSESRLTLLNLNIYVPRDERFSQVKFSDFLAYAFKSLGQVLLPEFVSLFDKTINEFDSFEDLYKLYDEGFEFPNNLVAKKLKNCVSWELLRELIRTDGERPLKFPFPSVISVDRSAWRTDEEFGREMLAGVNPVAIRRLQEFPPVSRLDKREFGDQDSKIRWEDIEQNMNGLGLNEALEENRLFILDHHDSLMPYLARINTTNTQTYATRTVLLLQDDCTLKPLAIELSLPHPQGQKHGATSKVFTPAHHGVEGSVWQLAKAYVAVNDTGCHQLLSHWLNTHAVIEPFIIAANRQLSVLHPIFKLLQPHFRDTMNINALARHTLINSGGVLEVTVFPGKYALELSSFTYRDWVFPDQALPADLLKRGIAVPDPSQPNGVRLLIEDYPYAVDGLEIWSAIEEWVREYCSCYYTTDEMVSADSELQSWWKELVEVGHGDLKHKGWWPKMQGTDDLIQTCTLIVWIASALHAAINFGQYPYGGFLPNRPSVSRRFMPEPGSKEYKELESNPDLAYLKTITAQFQTLLGVSLIEVLSRHSSDEVYLGQRENKDEWTSDEKARQAFERFHDKLVEIEKNIMERNGDDRLKNRRGPVDVPYTLLIPDAENYSKIGGLTGKGIPNSVSI